MITTVWSLIHWGRDKMAAISQTTLSNAFLCNENVRISIQISLKFVSKGQIINSSIGSDNGLEPTIWTNDSKFTEAYASLGLNELNMGGLDPMAGKTAGKLYCHACHMWPF